MPTAETPIAPALAPLERPRHWPRRLVKLVLWGTIFAIVAVAAAPSLLPATYVRSQVAKALANKLQKPVSVEAAEFSWRRGLRVTGIRILEGDPAHPEALFAKADSVSVSFSPLDLPTALTGGNAPIDALRLAGFECWIAIDDVGRAAEAQPARTKEAALGSESVRARSVQVVDGTIHVQNRRLGRTLDLHDVNVSVGELATTGRGYINLTAGLPGLPGQAPGKLTVTASLNNLDFVKPDQLVGSLMAEWNQMAWAETLAVFLSDADVLNAAGCTSGRISVSFGRGQWTAEGAIEATQLSFKRPGLDPNDPATTATLLFDRAILGFQLARTGERKPVDLHLVRFSTRGLNLRLKGRLDPDAPKGPEANLEAEGSLDWAPLAASVSPLQQVTDRFEFFGGGAQMRLAVETKDDQFQVKGSIDLTGTRAIWPEVINKESGRAMRANLEAAVARDFSRLAIRRLDLVGEAGRIRIQGQAPLGAALKTAGATTIARPAATPVAALKAPEPATLGVKVECSDIRDVRHLYPFVDRALGPLDATGPVEASIAVEEQPAAGRPSSWAVKTHVDLTPVALSSAGHICKAPAIATVADLDATIAPDLCLATLDRFELRLNESTVAWSGTGRVQWPAKEGEAPAGALEGELDLRKVESAAAIVGAVVPSADKAPLVGSLKVGVRVDFAERQLRGTLKADLTNLAIRVEDQFLKPAGQAASASIDGTWRMGEVHKIEGTLRATTPLAQVIVKGAAQAKYQDVAPAAASIVPGSAKALEAAAERGLGEEQAAGLRRLTFGLARDNALSVQAEVTDLGRVAEFSPALATRLEGAKLSGPGRATLVVSMGSDTAHIGGLVDLTDTAVEVPQALVKPPQMPLRLAMQANLLPPRNEGMIRLQLETLEVALDASSALLTGWIEFAPPASADALKSPFQVVSLLSEADFKLTAKFLHRAELRKALPWLEPVYTPFTIEGETTLTAEFAGTPTRGHVGIGLEATSCQFVRPDMVTKPKGTPATLQIGAGYGEVPGELVLERFDLRLADAQVSVTGRLLFDNPRLSTLAPPSTWAVRTEVKAPNVEALAALFPARLAVLKPAGSVDFAVQMAADPKGLGLDEFDLSCNKARILWLGRPLILNGKVSYSGDRLATEGLGLTVGRSDVTLVAYVSHPDDAPTGSLFIRGKTLDIIEVQQLIQESHQAVTAWTRASGVEIPTPKPDPAMTREAAQRVERFLSRALVSGDIKVDRMRLPVAEWNSVYDLENFTSDCRLGGNRFVVPEFHCSLNGGDVTGQVVLDFRERVPRLALEYNARNLQMRENLKPFIDTTFPGMTVTGSMSTEASLAMDLAPGSFAVGRGETILVEGCLEGPGAPEYMTRLFPGLALTKYPFKRMSNVFENLKGGTVDNRMIFVGKDYDVFIFGTSKPDKGGSTRTDYTAGIDLSAGLGSKVWSRDLDQGKIPLMQYTGRIIGPKWAEQNIRYVLPHELAWDVFVKRSLLTQVIRSLGRTPPDFKKPPVVPEPRAN